MDDIIVISNINNFIFCPVSIYFHNLYGAENKLMFQSEYQLNGTKAHETIDSNRYSTRANIITSLDVYSDIYRIVGKIDIYNSKQKMLIERKKHIAKIYDGYVFQLYAQYYCMLEMGYKIEKLEIHSIDDNKKYRIKLPDDDLSMKKKFEKTLTDMRTFNMESFVQLNIEKCGKCIYEDACDRALSR